MAVPEARLAEFRKRLTDLAADRRAVEKRLRAVREEVAAAEAAHAEAVEARDLGVAVASGVQDRANAGIASVVGRCLTSVFGGAYDFRLKFDRARGKSQVDLGFEIDGGSVDPVTAASGGAVDLTAFALRLACIRMSGNLRPLLVLDEPFKWLHGGDHRERVRELFEALASEMGVQIIMVTGCPEYITGNIIEL